MINSVLFIKIRTLIIILQDSGRIVRTFPHKAKLVDVGMIFRFMTDEMNYNLSV